MQAYQVHRSKALARLRDRQTTWPCARRWSTCSSIRTTAISAHPAQIEITRDRAVFFNAGKSLVGEKALAEGGRSQARNPLIARALRLIGFAELAGSGLRELNRAWSAVGRIPPKVESNTSANTFTLTLDWHPLPQVHDEFWKTRAGVTVTQTEAKILALCGGEGMTSARIAAAIGLPVDDVSNMLERLVVNALLQNKKGTFILVEHLEKLLSEWERPR
jgi:predicted HTH transcriptional regulator